MIIGNSMFTIFGVIDRSFSMFLGSLITLVMNIIQIIQKYIMIENIIILII